MNRRFGFKLKLYLSAALLLALALSFAGCVFKSSRPTDEQIELSVGKLLEYEESLLKCRENYTYEISESTRDGKGITLGIIITARLRRSIMTVTLSQRWRKLDDVWMMQSYEITDESARVLQQPTNEEILAVFGGSDAYEKLSANYPGNEKSITVSSVSWEDGQESAVAQISEEIVCSELVNVIYQSEQSLEWNRDDESWVSAGTKLNTDYALWLKKPPTDEEITALVGSTSVETETWNMSITGKEWEQGSASCAARVTLSKDYTFCGASLPYVYNIVWNEDTALWECESYAASPTEPAVYDFTNLNGKWTDKSNSENTIRISGAGIISFLPNGAKPSLMTTVDYSLVDAASSEWSWSNWSGKSQSGGRMEGSETLSWSLKSGGDTIAVAKLKKDSCEYSLYITASGIRAVAETGGKGGEIILKK